MPTGLDANYFNQLSRGHLPEHLGILVTRVEAETLSAELDLEPFLLAPNGFLHAGSVVSFADTCAGYGCIAHLPEGATSFTTVELKSNFLSTAREGVLDCVATAAHLGRTTQVWDAVVSIRGSAKKLALFRCTQLLLYGK